MPVDTGRHQDDPTRSFVDVLADLARSSGEEGMTLREILDRLDERSFGILVLVLAIPCLIPGLQGVPQVAGVLMLLLAVQVMFGREEPWLPKRLLDRRAPKRWLDAGAGFAQKRLRTLERLSRHRLAPLATGPGERWAALMIALGALCVIPPLTNTVPSIGLAFLAAGLIQRDGLFVAAGSVVVGAWVALLGAFGFALARGAGWATDLMARFGL